MIIHLVNVINVPSRSVGTADIARLLDPLDLKLEEPVFIKPNLGVPAKSSSGIVTDSKLIGALIDFLRTKGINRISVGEGPAIGYRAKEVFKAAGYESLAAEKEFELVDLNTVERKRLRWHYGEISIPRIVLDSFYINVAKLKTHVLTTVTLTMKNQKGLLLPGDKQRFHRDLGLHKSIAYLSEVVKPDLAIVDGLVGLQGDGPTWGGSPRKLGVLVAGIDMLAVDSVCCLMIGIEPEKVLHMRFAEEIGMHACIGKIYFVRNAYACSGCGDAIASALSVIRRNPRLWPRLVKVLYRALFEGIVLLTGKNAFTHDLAGKRICIGDCTVVLARTNGFLFVPGCPPQPKDIVETLLM